jgi:exodeoxyribonuclease-5
LFVIKGYAGTGKTSIVSALVNVLPIVGKRSVLLAPTGRAAKVLAGYSGRPAYTIHKKIYRIKTGKEGNLNLSLQSNLHSNTIFLVDEASMVQDEYASNEYSLFASRNLLEDLYEYIKRGNNCRLILIGDMAQLPPVGLNISPALDIDLLKARFELPVVSYEMTEVVRQEADSGILANATQIRNKITERISDPPYFSDHNTDVIRITGNELEDALNTAYSGYGLEEAVVICRSNKRANIFNQEIRKRILFQENEISAGDLLMVVRNNYYWLPEDSFAGFIANGDIIEVLSIRKVEEIYGFRFADITIRLVDYPEEKEIDTRILLETLHVESASLSWEVMSRLFNTIMEDYQDIPKKRTRIEKVRNNPYYNALQVKFSYALTCHKTQGGQWNIVFIDQGYITDKMLDAEYLRWLYTAVTRATEKLYLVNFNDNFFISR